MKRRTLIILIAAGATALLTIAILLSILIAQNAAEAERDRYEYMREVCKEYIDAGDIEGMIECRSRFE